MNDVAVTQLVEADLRFDAVASTAAAIALGHVPPCRDVFDALVCLTDDGLVRLRRARVEVEAVAE